MGEIQKNLSVFLLFSIIILSPHIGSACIQDTVYSNTLEISSNDLSSLSPFQFAHETGLVFSVHNIFRGLLGMVVLILVAWLFSNNRNAISWKLVFIGLSIQVLLAIGVLQVPAVNDFFGFIGRIFVRILDFTKAGTEFLFGGFLDTSTFGFIFAFQVLPTIIFFSALTSLLFYLGVLQKIVFALAWLMTKALKLSGAESLSVAGNVFLGQTESPLMIKAYLPRMTSSEILLVMTGGMATLAGGVLAAYISFLGGDDPVQRLMFARHLLAASIMAAPGAVVISKILYPQTESIDSSVQISMDKIGSNVLDAISNGTTEGLKLAANVAAMLLVFVAFIAMFNYMVGKIGDWTNLNPIISEITQGQYQQLSLQFILGYTFAPVMWVIGIALPDITLAGRLLGEKIIMTEFIGYVSLAELKDINAFADPRSVIMATYMLCGFANFASIGIQIGGIGSIAPTRRVLLSRLGMRALLGGTLAGLMSAAIVGMILV
jgi:concentrative nucleoside transporter, CNT family